MVDSDLMFFALEASRGYGEQVSQALGVPISSHEERDFEDGEHKARPLVNVRNRDVFVLHSLYADSKASANDKLCRLLFFIGALNDASAASVTAVVPFLCYARKDRKTQPRDPVTTRYVAALFDAMGTDRIVTVDVHNLMAYQNAYRCHTDHLEATKLFVEHFAGLVGNDEVAVVSPDPGGVKRADRFQNALTRRLGRQVTNAFVEKYRAGGVVRGEALIGDVKGRVAIILDDLISTGGTLARAARACKAQGARRVFAAATHGLFVGKAEALLQEPAVERIVVTDTVPPFRLPAEAIATRLTVLETAPLLAAAIRRIHDGGSLVELLQI
jgi:ribose-phosphate pyrophosphokinase